MLLLFGQPLMAQTQFVGGTVVDPSGAVIPSATITVKDLGKNEVVRKATSDAAGHFQAIGIEPGHYSLTIEASGFKTTQMNVNLDVNQKVDIGKVQLDVGQVNQVMSVSEVAPQVETATMEKAFTVDQTQMSQLPMNGRNWTALMSTMPGMTSAAQSDFNVNFNDVSQFHGLGGRGSENNFYLDGSPNVDVGDNQSQYTQPSIDSIAEFRIMQSSFNAEYGRAEAMAVAVQTKSGSSSFHGTLYEYFRNQVLDAKCVLCNTLQPALRYNQFGGNFSGWVPVPKLSTKANKRIFFFYNREMTRRDLPSSGYADVPDQNQLNGNFSELLTGTKMQYAPSFYNGTIFEPGTVTKDGSGNITGGTPYPNNTIPSGMINPLSAALLKVYSNIPGYSGLTQGGANPGFVRYFYNNPDMLTKNQDLLRVDYAISSRFSSFFRWVNDYQKEQIQTGIWTGEPFPIQPQVRPKPGSSWSWNLVSTFTPTLVAETILSYNHQSQSLSIVGANPVSISALGANFAQLYPAANITNTIPNVSAGSVNYSFGDPGWHNWGKDYGVTENITKVLNQHTIKFGAYFNRDDKAQTATWPQNANINFNGTNSMVADTGNGLANLLLGNYSNYNSANAAVFPYFRFWSAEAYIQDSWKVNSRLTLEYGLRFQHTTPTYTIVRGGTPGGEGNWTLYSVDLTKYNPALAPAFNVANGTLLGNPLTALSNEGLVCDPCSGTPAGFSPAKNFFEPRLGFAYDLFGDGKSSLRAGFGMFNERLRQNNFNFGAGSSWPNQSNAAGINGNVSTVDVAAITGANPPIQAPNMDVWPRDNTMPTIYSWYVGFQRQLPANFTLDISYNGNRSVHLMDQRLVNALPAGTLFAQPNLLPSHGNQTDEILPYLGWGNLTAIETNAYSRYNAMMVRVSHRFSNRISVNFNYTLSRAMDVADNDSDTINNPFNIAQSYAVAGYDQPQVFSTDLVYDLPNVHGAFDKPVVRTILNGWEVTGIFRAQSGMPYTIYSNGNLGGVNAGNQYVNVVGDPYAGTNQSLLINPAALQRPADGQYGNTGRNAFRLPAIQNLDASIMKNFMIGERVKLTYRCEIFNVANHPEVWGFNGMNNAAGFSADNPLGGLSKNDANFGQVNAWRDPRNIQMALRLSF